MEDNMTYTAGYEPLQPVTQPSSVLQPGAAALDTGTSQGAAPTIQTQQPASPTLTDMFGEYRSRLTARRTDARKRARYDALGRMVGNVFRPVAWGVAGTTAAVPADDRTQYLKAIDRADRIDDALDNLELQRTNNDFAQAQRLLQESRANAEYDRRQAMENAEYDRRTKAQQAYQSAEKAKEREAEMKALELKGQQSMDLKRLDNEGNLQYANIMYGRSRSGGGSSASTKADADAMYEMNRLAAAAQRRMDGGTLSQQEEEMMNLLSTFRNSTEALKAAKEYYPKEYASLMGPDPVEEPEPTAEDIRKAEKEQRKAERADRKAARKADKEDNRMEDPFA